MKFFGKCVAINRQYLLNKYDYDSQTSSVIGHNCKEQTHLNSQTRITIMWTKTDPKRNLTGIKEWSNYTYRLPVLSNLPSNWSTSTSTMAASRYFLMLRTILIATKAFESLSQHSKTWPKVPNTVERRKIEWKKI